MDEHAARTPVTAYWIFGGAPHCLACATAEAAVEDAEIEGGYPIETDRIPTCPGCGVDLDLRWINEEAPNG